MSVTLSRYTPRKRFRSPKNARRAKLAAARQRRWRLYEAAVKAGHPLALEAEFFRDPMKHYHAHSASLGAAERATLLADCQRQHKTPESDARYRQLRDQVIAAAEEMFT